MQEHTHTQRLWRKRAQQRLVDEEFQRVRCCLLSLARLRQVADNYYRTALSANVVTALFQCLWRAAKNSRPFVASVINNNRCQLLQKNFTKVKQQQRNNNAQKKRERQPSASHGKAERTASQGAVFSATAQHDRWRWSAQSGYNILWEPQHKDGLFLIEGEMM